MIKFFRKIRQNLLTENKFSNYLIYAIGEIILVVIGILIALAINQKNSIINNNELKNLYLIQLNEETDRNIKDLVDYKENIIKRLAELDTLFQILVNKEYDSPNLLSKSRYLYQRNTFNPTMTTYENLKFSGDLKLFDDINLRNSISETYNTFNRIKTVEQIDLEVINVYYQDYYMSNARTLDLNLSSENFGKDIYFENTVIVRIVTLKQIKSAYENSIESLEELKITFAELQNDN